MFINLRKLDPRVPINMTMDIKPQVSASMNPSETTSTIQALSEIIPTIIKKSAYFGSIGI